MFDALLNAIFSLCFPLLLLVGAIWAAGTLAGGENPIEVLKELFGCCFDHQRPGPNTLEEYAEELLENTPYENYEIYQPTASSDLNDELDEIRDQKRLAEIQYCVLTGKEKIIEREIEASSEYRDD